MVNYSKLPTLFSCPWDLKCSWTRLEKWFSGYKHLVFFQVQFPASNGAVSRDLSPSFDLYIYLVHRQKCKQNTSTLKITKCS